MYEAAARDFLSKYADGDVIKLRLLQSNEFRECLEKYGAALNVSPKNGDLDCNKNNLSATTLLYLCILCKAPATF